MLNMFISVMNCRSGFPEVAGIKMIPFRELGTIQEAVESCVIEFDKFASQFSGTAPFAEHKDELIALANKIQAKEQIISKAVYYRREDGKLVQRVLTVSVRSGDDLPTRRY